MKPVKIGARNTWFGRNIFAILDVVKLVLLLVLLVTFINFNIRLSEQVTAIRGLTTEQKKNTDVINKHLDCLVQYFSNRNRTSNTAITNVTPCSIDNPGQTSSIKPSTTSSAVIALTTPATVPTARQVTPPITQPTPTGPPDPNGMAGGSNQSFLQLLQPTLSPLLVPLPSSGLINIEL